MHPSDAIPFSPRRAGVVLSCVAAALLCLIGRVAWLQTYGRQQTITKLERQTYMNQTQFARRGTIFDATGNVLAGTVQNQALFVDPKFMFECFLDQGLTPTQIQERIGDLADLIDYDRAELMNLLDERSESRFVRLMDSVSEEYIDAVRELGIPGVGFTPVHQRFYPMGSLAAHVLGGVGTEGKGLEGIELKYESVLAGRNGYKRTMKDARRRGIAVAAEDYLPPQHGKHIILTIDANIQMIAEQELEATCMQFRAKAGECVVMDPLTGAVLAMASYPAYHPQHLEDSTADRRTNRAIVIPFEPGSTAKPFIVGPALKWGITRLDEVWPLPRGGGYKSSLRSKLVTDVHYYGPLPTWDILVKSSNIGMAMLGERMGKERIREALASFGFGRPTGVELYGEDPGLLRPASQWGNADVISTVQGYAMLVTPMQLARAMSVYANGGRLVQPHLLRGILEPDGRIHQTAPSTPWEQLPEVVDTYTAREMRRVLADVPLRGTGRAIKSKTYNIFGKTGTAHVAHNGNYNESSYTSSFVGGAPFERPRLVVAFIIHEPDRSIAHFGGTVSAPGAANVLERSLKYLQVPPSPELDLPPEHIRGLLYAFDPKVYRKPQAQLAAARD